MRAMPKSGKGFPVLGEQNVRGFDVTVQGAKPVCGLEGSGNLHSDVQRLHPGERADGMDPCAQRVLRMVLHHDVGPARRRGADVKNADDVRMPAQLAHSALLAQKPLDIVRIEVRGEHLHGDGALQEKPNPKKPTSAASSSPAAANSAGAMAGVKSHPSGRRGNSAIGHLGPDTPYPL